MIPIKIDYLCDTCRNGMMRPIDIVDFASTDGYAHQCNNMDCRYTTTLKRRYPYMTYEEVLG